MKAHLTSTGMVPVPRDIRDRLGLTPGSLVDLEVSGESLVIRRPEASRRARRRVMPPDAAREAYAGLWFWRRIQP